MLIERQVTELALRGKAKKGQRWKAHHVLKLLDRSDGLPSIKA